MYEVRAYKTQEDYRNYTASVILDGLETEQGALDEGECWLSDHEVVKVQSSDREFIQVLERKPRSAKPKATGGSEGESAR
jgi:hypothetical protein